MPKLLDTIAAQRPDDEALVDEHGRTTWGELHERTRRLINVLRDAGVGPGETIAMMLGNRRECFEVFQACAHLGTTYVPVNWHWVADELAYVLEDSGATMLIVDTRFVDVARAALADERSAGVTHVIVVGEPGSGVPLDGAVRYEDALAGASTDDLAEADQLLDGPMFYTSGTTGRPKGVRGALSGSTEIPTEIMGLIASGMSAYVPEAGRSLLVGPVYHSAQWAFTFMPMVSGSAVVMRHKFDPAETIRLIGEETITNVHMVPTQFKRMLDVAPERRAELDTTTLAACWHGAAPCPPSWKQAMIDWFGPVVHEYYGSTEGSFISAIRAPEWIEKRSSVGRPLDTVEVIVVDDEGNRLGVGEEGTLYFRSLMGMDFEHHNAPDKTADAHLEPGVFTTGDVGFIDEDGYLHLSDRKIDMIISGGVNIYPAEIEAVIAEHDGVADVADIGVPNDEFGEEVKAVVELSDGVDATPELAEELLSACRERLAGYKRPRSVDFVVSLPRTGTGKILKRELRGPYWEGTGRSI